jgi:hypothetical protein
MISTKNEHFHGFRKVNLKQNVGRNGKIERRSSVAISRPSKDPNISVFSTVYFGQMQQYSMSTCVATPLV